MYLNLLFIAFVVGSLTLRAAAHSDEPATRGSSAMVDATSLNFVATPKNEKTIVKLTVATGKIAGKTAYRLYYKKTATTPDEDLEFYVDAGKAKDWNTANEMCEKLAPLGTWHLPIDNNSLMPVMAGIVPKLKPPHSPDRGTEGALYPLWIRLEKEEKTNKELKDKDTFITFQDGKGTGSEAMGFRSLLNHNREVVAEEDAKYFWKRDSKRRDNAKAIVKFLEDGVTVLCVAKAK